MSIVDYSVTQASISSQITDLLMSIYRPDLKQKSDELFKLKYKLENDVMLLEEQIISKISLTEDIVEDSALVDELDALKEKHTMSIQSLQDSESLFCDIKKFSNIFLQISAKIANAFDFLQQMSSVIFKKQQFFSIVQDNSFFFLT